MMRTGVDAASRMKRNAISSGSTACTRSSVERITLEIIDVTMMVTMNQEAIFTPSGRSTMLTAVVYAKTIVRSM